MILGYLETTWGASSVSVPTFVTILKLLGPFALVLVCGAGPY